MAEETTIIESLPNDLRRLFTPQRVDRRTSPSQAKVRRGLFVPRVSFFLDFFKRVHVIPAMLGILTGILGGGWLGPILQQLIVPNDEGLWSSVLTAGSGLVLGLLANAVTWGIFETVRIGQASKGDRDRYTMNRVDDKLVRVTPQIREWAENAVGTKRLPKQALQYYNDKIAAVERGLRARRSLR